MNKSSKRRLSSMEDDSRDELSSDGGGRGRSSTPEPGRKRKKLDPVRNKSFLKTTLYRKKESSSYQTYLLSLTVVMLYCTCESTSFLYAVKLTE